MRICILTRGDLFPTQHGAAVKIVRTAEALSRSGSPSFVVTDDRDRYLRFDEGACTEVPFSPRFRAAEEWPPLPRLGRWAERLCSWVGYPRDETFLYRPMFDPTWWLRAVEVGRREKIDVFQAEFPGYGVPAWMAARALSKRCSIVQHNVEWDRLAEFGHDVSRIRRVERSVLARMDDVIAVSRDDRDRMVAAGLDAGRITVIPHGVEVARFRDATPDGIRARYGIDADAPLLFFHGTLHYWPNTEAVRFIADELLPRLLPDHPRLRVLIPGMNPPNYYAHPAIVFPGAVDDLAAHVAAADVALCPIVSGGGTRMKLLEYMAARRAVVSTTKGAEGIRYTDGEQLRIADGAAPFATAVAELLADPDRRVALGWSAGRFAARYDWEAVGRSYTELYQGEGRGGDRSAGFGSPVTAAPSVDEHLPPGRLPSKPLTLLLLINRGCNLRCVFCDLWDGHVHMPTTRFEPLLDDAVAIGTRTLVITGGEPFLHPDLFEAVRAAKARGMAVNITTNGTLIDRHWDRLVQSGVDSLSFSIDGLEATHDTLRGHRGAYKRTIASLDRVIDDGRIGTSVYFVVTNKNVAELVDVYDRVTERGARFDFWPVNDAPELYLRTPEDKAAWRAAVTAIAERDPAVAARAAYYEEALDYHAGEAGPVRCLGLVDQYGVTYTGDLLPCCVWGGDGLVVGNVFERSLRELWVDPEVQRYRANLHADGCTVGCYNHSLYEFAQSTGEPFRVSAK